MEHSLKTNVYIDGFNLYYGCLKNTTHKWLDISKLCMLLLPGHTVNQIKYYTAYVTALPHDPDQPVRQQTYLRALLPHIDFIKKIRSGVLAASQFPPTLVDAHGTIHKPTAW
jgi:hypothetical protein